MFYGSSKTKLYLWTIVIVLAISIGCFGAALFGAGLIFVYVAFGGSVFAIAYSQLGVFKDVNKEIKKGNMGHDAKEKIQEKDNIRNTVNKKKKQEEIVSDNEYNQYTKENIKKYLVAYKVKKQSFLVIIDSSEKYHIKNCPAYVWGDKKYLYFLLLEKKVRTIAIPRTETAILRYEKGAMVTDLEEYKKLKESFFLGSLFRKFIPEYYRTMVNGFSTFKKNLFIVAFDVKVSAPSVRGIMEITNCRLELDDSQLDRKRFGGYFAEAYKINLLLREEIYDAEEYKIKIREILTGLAEHEEQIDVFRNTLSAMLQYRLISSEYAEYYMNYRYKLEKKK